MSAEDTPQGQLRVDLDVYTNPSYVHTRQFSRTELMALCTNLLPVWVTCCDNTPMLDMYARFVFHDKLLVNNFRQKAFISSEAVGRFNDDPEAFTYRYATMCITVLVMMTSTRVAIELLEFDMHGVLLGIQSTMREILASHTQPPQQDIQLHALTNIVNRSAYHRYPTKPLMGMIEILNVFDLDEDRRRKIMSKILRKTEVTRISFDS